MHLGAQQVQPFITTVRYNEMEVKILYRYKRPDGGITVSLDEPSVEYTKLHRIIADEGMVLTDGNITTPCKDVESIDGWAEIESSEEIEE